MKLISPEAARLIEFLFADETRSWIGNKISIEGLLALIQERYSFVGMPTPKNVWENAAVFSGGQLIANGRVHHIKEVRTLYNGMIIDMLTSDACRLFFDDLMDWGRREFDWKEPTTKLPPRNFSGVVVEFDPEVEERFELVSQLTALFSSALAAECGIAQPVFLKTLGFSCDPAKLPADSIQTDILFQRRADFPYEKGRYYVTGPFETDKLLVLLEHTEALILGKQPPVKPN